jgi:hypothetical protein
MAARVAWTRVTKTDWLAGHVRHEWTLLICYPDNVDRSPYRIPIQRIDGRCDRVRASTHRWLDEAPTSKGACLRLSLPTLVHHSFLPQRSGCPDCSILNRRRKRYRLCTSIRLRARKTELGSSPVFERPLMSRINVADEQSAENCAPATILLLWGQRPTGGVLVFST